MFGQIVTVYREHRIRFLDKDGKEILEKRILFPSKSMQLDFWKMLQDDFDHPMWPTEANEVVASEYTEEREGIRGLDYGPNHIARKLPGRTPRNRYQFG